MKRDSKKPLHLKQAMRAILYKDYKIDFWCSFEC